MPAPKARAQERAAPEHGKAARRGELGQLACLRAPGAVERHRQMSLEAALQVVGGLAVARQIDASPSLVCVFARQVQPGGIELGVVEPVHEEAIFAAYWL